MSFGSTFETGTYTVEGTSSSGCVLTMQNGVLVTNFPCGMRVGVGVADLFGLSVDSTCLVSVLGNPVESILSLRFNKSISGEVLVVLIGLGGEELCRRSLFNLALGHVESLFMEGYAGGSYVLRVISSEPVSYTHLDVYKRQGLIAKF